MKQRLSFVVLALAITALGGGAVAYAQAPVNVTIDFAFIAGGKSMPAGTYAIQQRPAGGLVLHPQKGGPDSPMLSAITRLARLANDGSPRLVFDKTAEGPLLSEIWLPREDGYCLLATSKEHQHQIVVGTPKN